MPGSFDALDPEGQGAARVPGAKLNSQRSLYGLFGAVKSKERKVQLATPPQTPSTLTSPIPEFTLPDFSRVQSLVSPSRKLSQKSRHRALDFQVQSKSSLHSPNDVPAVPNLPLIPSMPGIRSAKEALPRDKPIPLKTSPIYHQPIYHGPAYTTVPDPSHQSQLLRSHGLSITIPKQTGMPTCASTANADYSASASSIPRSKQNAQLSSTLAYQNTGVTGQDFSKSINGADISDHMPNSASTPQELFDEEEVRASFRSALTTASSFHGTSGTERSSVMTRGSSFSEFPVSPVVGLPLVAEPRTSDIPKYKNALESEDMEMTVEDAIDMYLSTNSNEEEMMLGEEERYQREATITGELSLKSNDYAGNSYKIEPDSYLSTSSQEHHILTPPSLQHRPILANEPSRIKEPTLSSKNPPFGTITTSQHPTLPRPMAHPKNPPDSLPQSPSQPPPQSYTSNFENVPQPRDRYGFRKRTQYITPEQYDEWNSGYTESLLRRKKKWIGLMKESNLQTDNPVRFPPKSNKVKRFVRKGIPPEWRGPAWFWYAGGHMQLLAHPGLFSHLLGQAEAGNISDSDKESIERDLHRTFPDNIRFKPPVDEEISSNSNNKPPETKLLRSLRRVLQAFCLHCPHIGYCQSLNFLAGLLLIFMEEERAFWMLCIITKEYLPGTHDLSLEGSSVDQGVLMASVRESMPGIWSKIGGELDGSSVSAFDTKNHLTTRLPPITLCTAAWFMSCFIGNLPIETVLRVWDCFFFEGSKTLFRISLAIFKLGEPEIRAVSDPSEIFQVVQTIPRRLLDAGSLMDTCYKRRIGFTQLSQNGIDQRRTARRAMYSEERAEAERNRRLREGGAVQEPSTSDLSPATINGLPQSQNVLARMHLKRSFS
ncbi:MAG: hypothetical protein M1829_006103 [Trizodia sp. TS-e1964]|nr:MAG: hypothetical protein M1829_006103 [Trizodia sp. TS-e1964]